MITKPIVTYSGKLNILPWDYNPKLIVARIELVLDHPRLGRCYDVRTTQIVAYPDKDGTFETRNTIYKRAVE
jgi:hypothetical protein